MNSRRNLKIFAEAMFPLATLQTVGDAYGISRERVRQIIAAVCREYLGKKIDWKEMKAGFRASSYMFRCLVCGETMSLQRARNSKIYTCLACRPLAVKYDLKKSVNCAHCDRPFFTHRVRKYYNLNKSYCSMKCYMNSGGNRFWEMINREKYIPIEKKKVECSTCGKSRMKRPSAIRPDQKDHYCDRACFHYRGSEKRRLEYKSRKNQRLHVELVLMKIAHLNAAISLTQHESSAEKKK